MSNDVHAPIALATLALFAGIALLIVLDLVIDYGEGASLLHIGLELAVLVAAAAGIGLLTFRLRRARADLDQARADASRWRDDNRALVDGIGAAVASQFARWQLTAAEAEVGRFLLKGYSHKEIAGFRQTSERTIREQSRAIYRKSGLAGRSALSAFFLEDLLLP